MADAHMDDFTFEQILRKSGGDGPFACPGCRTFSSFAAKFKGTVSMPCENAHCRVLTFTPMLRHLEGPDS